MEGLFKFPELLEYQEPQRPYLIKHLLHMGTKLMMGGPAKHGKSFILHGMLYALATGTPLFGNSDFPTISGPGILFSQELGPQELKRRWTIGYATDPMRDLLDRNLTICPRDYRISLDDQRGQDFMETIIFEVCNRLQGPLAWIALDPISKFHTGKENDFESVAKLMRRVEGLQYRAGGAAVILVHHFGHASESKSLYRVGAQLFRGSTHFIADVDTAFTLDRTSPPNARAPYFICDFVTRHGEPIPRGWIQLDGDSVRPTWKGEYKDGQKRPEA